MKKFYTILSGILFFALTASVNGQSQKNESTGISTEKSSLKSSTVYDLIRLRIENEHAFDATVVYYHETFVDGRGPEDSDKMFNTSENIPEIFTRIGNSAMAINGFSALDGKGQVSVPVSVRNRVYDECEITADVDDFTEDYEVVLEDKEEEEYINLRKSSYTYTPSVLGIEDERFVLHLTRSSRVATGIDDKEEDMEESVRFTSGNDRLNVDVDPAMLSGSGPQARIDVFSRSGRKLTSRRASGGINQIELAGGQIYIVSVNMGNQTITKKVAVR
ncbi:MAG: T9SS type A sorting domain-containing protein [Marinilabilia sp.]